MKRIKPSEITPEHVYLSRRSFLAGIGALAAGSLFLNACAAPKPSSGGQEPGSELIPPEPADIPTPLDDVTGYNNFYEFTTSKTDVAPLSRNLKISPWTVQVGGLVGKPQTFAIEDLLKKFPSEERVYRMRCVEAWSMVIPWLGFPLASLLKEVERPRRRSSSASQRFTTPNRCPARRRRASIGLTSRGFAWTRR